MIVDRNEYVEQLLAKCWNGKVKIVTGKDVPRRKSILSQKKIIFTTKYNKILYAIN